MMSDRRQSMRFVLRCARDRVGRIGGRLLAICGACLILGLPWSVHASHIRALEELHDRSLDPPRYAPTTRDEPRERISLDELGQQYDRDGCPQRYGKALEVDGYVTGSQDDGIAYINEVVWLRGDHCSAEITCVFKQGIPSDGAPHQSGRFVAGQRVRIVGRFEQGHPQPLRSDRLVLRDCWWPDEPDRVPVSSSASTATYKPQIIAVRK